MRTVETPMKSNVKGVGLMKSTLNARAVPMSVIKVADIIFFPIMVFDNPVSTKTEYTTANEVVDNAQPAINAPCNDQCDM